MCGNFKRLYCLLVSMSHYSKSLINAAESGDLKKTEYYLTKTNPVPVDSTDDENQTALHYACANGHKDIVRLLIKHGASLECVNWTGWTPLMYASYYGHKDVVAILIDIKANINARNNRFSTPLTCAARCGYTDVVELLLKSGAGCDPIFKIDKGDKNGHRAFVTPLMASAQHGHFRIVDLLLQYEADVNYQNPDTNCTALMLAAANGHFDIVELLINKGNANPNLKNSRGDNALLMSKEHEEVYKFLKIRTEKQKKERPTMKESYQSLFEAVRGNSEELAKLLNTQGINVNEKDVNGATPLIYACIHKKVQNVRLLLSKGADPNIQEQLQGWTALMQATIRKCVDIVKILLDHNANILIKNSKGLTVFDLATYVGEPQITRLLCPKLIDEQRSNSNNEKNKQGVKTMISRVGEKFGIKSSQANQTLNRVSPYDLYNGPSIMGTSHESDEPELRKTASVLSALLAEKSDKQVLTSANIDGVIKHRGHLWVPLGILYNRVLDAKEHMNGTRRARISLVSPQQNLPDDVLAPVLPPYSNLSNFNLPKMPVMGVKLSNSQGSAGEVSPYNSSNDSASFQLLNEVNNTRNLARSKQQTSTTFSRPETDSLQSSFSSGMTSISTINKRPAVMPSAMFPPKPPNVKQPTIAWPDTSTFVSNIPPIEKVNNSNDYKNTSSAQQTPNGKPSSGDDINDFLSRLALEKYRSVFEEEEIDKDALPAMNDDDLKSIGIDVTLDRQGILNAIKAESGFDFDNKQKTKSMSQLSTLSGGTKRSHIFMSPSRQNSVSSTGNQGKLLPIESIRRQSNSSSSTLSQR